MDLLAPEILLLLLLIAMLAGFIDAIAGGGGLLTLPALIWVGVPPLAALATNKLQGSFGTLAATVQFVRKKQVDLRQLAPAIVLTFLGGAFGTWSVSHISNAWLDRIIPVLLILFSLYFLFADKLFRIKKRQHLSIPLFGATAGFGVGYYDGFFGPGTGAFFVATFVLLMGWNLTRATAGTKVLNLTSNLAALLLFSIGGHVLWMPGLLLGVAQMAGAWIGAHMAIHHGDRIICPLLVTVALIVAIKLLLD
ncbi:MAG: TSUP family transporter [bacterium]